MTICLTICRLAERTWLPWARPGFWIMLSSMSRFLLLQITRGQCSLSSSYCTDIPVIYVVTVPKVSVRYLMLWWVGIFCISVPKLLVLQYNILKHCKPMVLVRYVMRCSRICIVEDPGCLSRFPDPNFSTPDPGSRVKKIPDSVSGSASKNLSIFGPKNCF